MKLYKISTQHPEGNNKLVWVGTQADAAKTRKGLVEVDGFKRAQIATEEIDVPTDKAGLLAFLNGDDSK